MQKGWVWDEERLRSRLASVSLSHPVGAIVLRETGVEGVRLKPSPIAGVDLAVSMTPRELLVDGQRRRTARTSAVALVLSNSAERAASL